MLTHCVDEQRSMQPLPLAAGGLCVPRAHLLRCASSEMEGHRICRHASHLAPWRTQRGPRDFRLGLLGAPYFFFPSVLSSASNAAESFLTVSSSSIRVRGIEKQGFAMSCRSCTSS